MDSYVVNASALNLRAAPEIADNVLRVLNRGTTVQGLAVSPDKLWRKIKAEVEGWVFAKYLAPVQPGPSLFTSEEEYPWMALALSELGIKEVPGPGDNPRIVEYLQSTDLDHAAASQDETPWCSGFVNWCIEKTGYAGTNSAWARSWIKWGKPLAEPRRGCVTVFTRDGGGHVAFYVGEQGGNYLVLGGNQNNAVCVAAYAKSRLLGFRAPN